MKRIAISAALLLVSGAASAQTLSPIVDGHVRRVQTVHEDNATSARACTEDPANNCVQTFVYFDKVYVGGQNSFTADFDGADSHHTVYWEDNRPIFEFDISSVPVGAPATLQFMVTGMPWYAVDVDPDDDALGITVYRSQPTDADGNLSACDFNAGGGGFDGARWIANGCSNLSTGSVVGTASLATGPATPSSDPNVYDLQHSVYTVDVKSAVEAARSSGQTKIGFVLGGNQSSPATTDPNFDGDEVIVASDSTDGAKLLIGTAPTPRISASFGSCTATTVGTDTLVSLTIRNVGTGTLTVSALTETADPCNAWSLESVSFPLSIATGQTTSIGATFSPSAPGTCGLVVRLDSNDASTPSKEVEGSCEAVAEARPIASISPTSTSCGPIEPGDASTTTVTIRNDGNSPLTLTAPTEDSDSGSAFVPTTGSFSTSVAPGASTSFDVTFLAPQTVGVYTASYSVATNDPDRSKLTVTFSCTSATTSATPVINVQGVAACVDTPAGGSSSRLVTVQNLGEADLEISSIAELDDPEAVFALDLTGTISTLEMGRQTTFRVIFAPISTDETSATFRITSNDPARPTFDFTLTCSGTSPAVAPFEVAPLVSAAGTSARFVAASAKAPGDAGTFWQSDLYVSNPGSEDVRYLVVFLEGGRSNLVSPTAELRIAPGGTTSIADVLDGGLFGHASTSGALAVIPVEPASAALLVNSRTYNKASSGTYGQFIGSVTSEAAVVTGEAHILAGLSSNASFRTNIGVMNPTSADVTVLVTFRSGETGEVVGNAVPVDLKPFGYKQVNRILELAGASPQDNAWAEIRVTSGSGAIVYASTIDNRSGDPIFVPTAH